MSVTDTWCMLVGSRFQCRGASAIWFVNHWWHLTSLTLICLAVLHAWTLEYQHMMLCVWRWIYLRKQKGNGQLEKTARSPSQRSAQQGSGGYANAIYAVEIWDRQGPRSSETVHSDYSTSTMMTTTTMMMMKDDLCQKWSVKLIFQGTYRLPGTGIVECLKIIVVGCNLKQFDAQADRRCIFHSRP